MQIEIIKVEVTSKGKYRQANVAYKGPNGKVEGKQLVSFVYKDVFEKLSNASPGDVFDVKSEKVLNEKDQKEYWQWTEAVLGGKSAGSDSGVQGQTSVSKTPVRSSYETPEERAARQVYIVRQSSLSTAVELVKATYPKGVPTDFSTDAIIELAKKFEDYVFAKEDDEVEVL